MIIMCMTTIKNKVRICPFIYIVCLLLFAACSNEDNAGKDIPSATFSIAPERGQIEGEIQFTNASYGGSGNFTYVWDFGDGTTSTEENPKHVYNEKGIFVVSLTITDSSGRSNLYRKTIEITDKVVEKGDLTLLWTSSTHLAKLVSNSAALSPDEKTVYINSNDHILHSYDVTSGIEKWSFDMTDPSWGAQATGGSNMTPSVDTDGTIYMVNYLLSILMEIRNGLLSMIRLPVSGIKVTPPMPKCVVCHQHLMINMYTVVMGEAPVQ